MRYRILKDHQYKDFCMLMILLSYTDQHLQEWMTEDRKIKLKAASKIIAEVIVGTTEELSKASAQRLKKNIDEVDLFCLPKAEAERTIKQSQKINTVKLREEAFIVLLESALASCKDPCGRNYKACILKKMLLDVGAEKYDPDARGVCPYLQTKKKIKK